MSRLRSVLLPLDCVLLAYFGFLLMKVDGSGEVIPMGVAFASILLHMVYLYRDKPKPRVAEEHVWLSL